MNKNNKKTLILSLICDYENQHLNNKNGLLKDYEKMKIKLIKLIECLDLNDEKLSEYLELVEQVATMREDVIIEILTELDCIKIDLDKLPEIEQINFDFLDR